MHREREREREGGREGGREVRERENEPRKSRPTCLTHTCSRVSRFCRCSTRLVRS
jgi:hypothetical protein